MIKDLLIDRGASAGLATWGAAVGATLVLLLLALAVDLVAKKIILRIVEIAARRSKTDWDDIIVRRQVLSRLAHVAPALVVRGLAPVAYGAYPTLVQAIETAALIYMALVILSALDALLNALMEIYDTLPIARHVAIKPFVQVVKIIVYGIGIVFVVSQLIGRSPLVFFSGLGAFSAVLMLIFKDSILGLVAGVQLMNNRAVTRGDWIEMPKYGIDGDVLDVSLTTVKVQNWDKTISTVPTYALFSETFKNWRGMSEAGGRRIKRSVLIDMNSIRFCDEEMLTRFRKFELLVDYLDEKQREVEEDNRARGVDTSELINGRRLTNVGTFRAYLVAYLRHHAKIHDRLTFLVRHLAPGPAGLPVEIYVFSSDTDWAAYEGIQADIFDHVLASVPLFDLRVVQAPTGGDVRELAAAIATGGGNGAEGGI